LRSDTRRNLRRLLEAAGELAREAPDKLTMQNIAARAEIGPATAYRYYSTVEDVLEAYVHGVLEQLREFSDECSLEGRELFLAILRRWMELLDEHGPAIVQLRSRRGFLERLAAENRIITDIFDAWRRPVSQLLDELGVGQGQLKYAMFLKNIMFDAREISDLRQNTDLGDDGVADHLVTSYIGAVRGWATAGTQRTQPSRRGDQSRKPRKPRSAIPPG
jgi:AcrR family transcriptional regulator